MRNKLLKNKLIIIFLLLAALLLPNSFNMPKETDRTAVVVALGLDSNVKGVEVSAQIIVPKFELRFNQNVEVISATGKNLAESLNTMSISLGKDIGLAHIGAVIMSDSIAETNDMALVLDMLLKNNSKNNNAVLISTSGSAKELLKVSGGVDNILNLSLTSIADFYNNRILNNHANLEEFFSDYFNENSISILGVIDVEEEAGIEQEVGGAESGEQSEKAKKSLLSEGSGAVFKKGIKQSTLKKEEMQNLNWFSSQFKKTVFTVDNVSDEIYNNASIGLKMLNKKTKIKTGFKNNVPRVYIDLTLELEIEEVIQEGENNYNQAEHGLTNALKNKIKSYVKASMAKALNYSKQNNLDVFNFYNLFKSFKNKQFKSYLNTLSDSDNYLQKIEVFTRVNVLNKR